MNFRSLSVGVAVLFLMGCSDPTIDASSDESMKESIDKVRDSLPESERKEFDDSIQILAFSQIDMKDLFAAGATGAGNLEGKVRDSLDGMTAEQVISEADRVRAERKARERQQALEEIKELEKRRKQAEHAETELEKFEVVRSRFYMREKQYGREQPVIELTVRNGTDKAVARAYFEGTLASPDRSVPWHEDTFNYSIPGGLEPGEEAEWQLAPNMFSDWGNIDAPADAVFTVTVEQIDGADGDPLYSTRDFRESDMERLNKLKQEFGLE